MVEFDQATDKGFRESLDFLEDEERLAIVEGLFEISQKCLSWPDFVSEHGWEEVVRHGEQTYPGADAIYRFLVRGSDGGLYQIAGQSHNHKIVICGVARQNFGELR